MKNSILILVLLSICFTVKAQCISGDCVNGKGTFKYSKGGVYVGDFKNGKKEGQGEYKWVNGDVYVGDFKNDKKEGQGEYKWVNGDVYTGSYINDNRDGFGWLQTIDGKKYGQWKEDHPVVVGCMSGNCENGYGTYKWESGVYVGDFKNFKRDGIGTYTNSKGEVFAGAWKNHDWFERGCLNGDCKDGFGTYVYEGTTYIGQFKNGRSHGEGTSIEKNGTTFKGHWEKGLKKGEGTETNPDGISLTGNWDSLFLRGQGTETLPNGYYMKAKFTQLNFTKNEKYFSNENVEISWKEYSEMKENKYSTKINAEKALAAQPQCISGDCQNGYGVIRYNDGTKYFGMCKNGTYEGLGYVVAPDVTTYKYDDKDGRDPYGGLYSLKQVPVVTPGKVSFGEWKNGVNTRTFNSMEEFSNVVARELPGRYEFNDYLFKTKIANMEAERKRIDRENEAAYGLELMKKMKNVSFTPSSSSSNETTVKTTTITKSGNEIIDFKTVPKQ
jgi:hypothetical protein